jgi:predicted MFS family arabinose efflux permease
LLITLIGGALLFVSVGARQGFGLFLVPLTHDLGFARAAFASAIALQYLVWGVAAPLAGMLADRYSAARVLAAAGACYAAGFACAATIDSVAGFVGAAGVLVGLGLGGASFGVVHAAVAQRVPEARRGSALGTVGAITALGQFVLLFFSEAAIARFGWRGAFAAHALLVAVIVPLAWPLRGGRGAAAQAAASGEPLARVLRRPAFWLLAAGFGFSGLQVMFTMTHLPAFVADLKLAPADAVHALAAVSFFSFVGSWAFGRLADRIDPVLLLLGIYVARALLAALATVLHFTPTGLVVYFSVLGVVWMSTIPLAGSITAQRFGTRYMASVFGTVFLAHQLGGFAGTWLGGWVFDRYGSYQPMWALIAALCGAGALLAWPLRLR